MILSLYITVYILTVLIFALILHDLVKKVRPSDKAKCPVVKAFKKIESGKKTLKSKKS